MADELEILIRDTADAALYGASTDSGYLDPATCRQVAQIVSKPLSEAILGAGYVVEDSALALRHLQKHYEGTMEALRKLDEFLEGKQRGMHAAPPTVSIASVRGSLKTILAKPIPESEETDYEAWVKDAYDPMSTTSLAEWIERFLKVAET